MFKLNYFKSLMRNYLKGLNINTFNGLSGNIQFDSFGKRENFTIAIVEKQRYHLELVCLFVFKTSIS